MYNNRKIKTFKIYLHDIGLLSAMSNLSSKTLLEGNEIFTEFKGALTEQFVLQQLVDKMIHNYIITPRQIHGWKLIF